MGCHTWFNKRLTIPVEQIKKEAISNIEIVIKRWESYKSTDQQMIFLGLTEERIENMLIFLNRCLQRCHKNYLGTISYGYSLEKSIHLFDGIFYEDAEYHDLFRRGHYPDDILKSYDETISYIENNIDKISFHISKEWSIEKLKEFWTKYPDGLIYFG